MPKGPSCRKCGAPVLMLKNDNTGNVAPIDPEPVEGGNVTVDPATMTYRVVPKAELQLSPNRKLHKSHFATCPHAQHFREGGR
jgi:hypothetical protein